MSTNEHTKSDKLEPEQERIIQEYRELQSGGGRARRSPSGNEDFVSFLQTLDPQSRRVLRRFLQHGMLHAARTHALRRTQQSHSEILVPRMDMYMTTTHAVATFEMAGMSKDQVKVEVANGVLTISGERPSLNLASLPHMTSVLAGGVGGGGGGGAQNVVISERRFGRIARNIKLPEWVRVDGISGKMENGVLTICLPFVDPNKPDSSSPPGSLAIDLC